MTNLFLPSKMFSIAITQCKHTLFQKWKCIFEIIIIIF